MKSLTSITIDYDTGDTETFGLRRPFSSWVRKDDNLRVPDDGNQYVQILDDTAVLGAPRQYTEDGLSASYPFPAVVNTKWGLITKHNDQVYDYVPVEDRWQRWMYEFWDWSSGYMLPTGEKVGIHVNPKNPSIIYTDYTPGSLIALYAGMIMDAKSHTDSASPETGARDVVTGRNLSNPKPYEWLCRPTTGALLKVRDNGSQWIADAIDLLAPCPNVDILPPHLYFWATQIHIDGNTSRYPDVKNALEIHGLPPAGTPMPLFSLGGSFLIRKSACKPLVNGQEWSPYLTR